ncbi:MAG: ACP phosphodiesterase [Cytophagaceae bacterium]
MNFLTHLFFSTDSVDNTRGLIIGNTAKENHLSKYNLDILKGIALDMQISNFSEDNPAFNNSRQRINSKYLAFSSFLVNIFYDHLLAKNWDKYSTVSMEEFSGKIYETITTHRNSFPYKIRKFAPEMVRNKWIEGIKSIEGTHQYINSISKNERFSKNLDQALFELTENYQDYRNDFEEYFAALRKFMEGEERRFRTITDEKEFVLLSA